MYFAIFVIQEGPLHVNHGLPDSTVVASVRINTETCLTILEATGSGRDKEHAGLAACRKGQAL